jgi:hypothetical protein
MPTWLSNHMPLQTSPALLTRLIVLFLQALHR